MELLDRPFFTDPSMDAWREAITRLSASRDFLSDTGIAPKAWRHNGMFDIIAYQDEHTRWPIMTHHIALAQYNLGNHRLAAEYWTRMLATVVASGSFREFVISDPSGNLYIPSKPGTGVEPTRILRAEENGEDNQTWTAAAVRQAIAILLTLEPEIFKIQNPTDESYESDILAGIPQYRDNLAGLIRQLKQHTIYYQREEPLRDNAGNTLTHHQSYTGPSMRPIRQTGRPNIPSWVMGIEPA